MFWSGHQWVGCWPPTVWGGGDLLHSDHPPKCSSPPRHPHKYTCNDAQANIGTAHVPGKLTHKINHCTINPFSESIQVSVILAYLPSCAAITLSNLRTFHRPTEKPHTHEQSLPLSPPPASINHYSPRSLHGCIRLGHFL